MKRLLPLMLLGCAAQNGSPGKSCVLTTVPTGVMIGCPDGSNSLLTNGTSGVSGRDGVAGTNGSNGVAGATGARGASGMNGTNGTSGTAGVKGERGATGLTGATGPIGPTGPRGPAGLNGIPGLGCKIVIIDHHYYLKCDDGSNIKLKKVPHD